MRFVATFFTSIMLACSATAESRLTIHATSSAECTFPCIAKINENGDIVWLKDNTLLFRASNGTETEVGQPFAVSALNNDGVFFGEDINTGTSFDSIWRRDAQGNTTVLYSVSELQRQAVFGKYDGAKTIFFADRSIYHFSGGTTYLLNTDTLETEVTPVNAISDIPQGWVNSKLLYSSCDYIFLSPSNYNLKRCKPMILDPVGLQISAVSLPARLANDKVNIDFAGSTPQGNALAWASGGGIQKHYYIFSGLGLSAPRVTKARFNPKFTSADERSDIVMLRSGFILDSKTGKISKPGIRARIHNIANALFKAGFTTVNKCKRCRFEVLDSAENGTFLVHVIVPRRLNFWKMSPAGSDLWIVGRMEDLVS